MSVDKRLQILEATAELISEHGLHCCPMALVAKEAQVGAGTIYRYFKTKDELIQQLYLHVSQQLADYCREGYPEKGTIRQRLDHILCRFYHYLLATPRDALLLDQLWATPAIKSCTHAYAMREINQLPLQLLDEAKANGSIKPLQNEILLTFSFGTLFSLVQRQIQTPERFVDPIEVQQLLNLCWDAVKL